MAEVKTLTVSDLLLLTRPVTGALSRSILLSNPSVCSEDTASCPDRPRKRPRGDENLEPCCSGSDRSGRNPRILAPLNYPVSLIGTVDLWSGVLDKRSGCSKNDCLLFTDGGASVCCDVLDIDIGMIGRRVRVLAWNFIPSKCSGGLLEIIKWELAEPPSQLSPSGGRCSELGFYPLCTSSDSLESEVNLFSGSCRIGRDEVSGQLNSVSPVFDVPCTVKSGLTDVSSESRSDSLNGFLAEFLACHCSECGSVMCPSHLYGKNVNPVTVYVCGAAAKWRPLFAKFVGSYIYIAGLKRKLVFVDGEAIAMLVSTLKTGMRLYRKEHEVSNEGALVKKNTTVRNEFTGQYTGVVTGVYMQGMVIELDEKVWLVLTDRLINPHSLRVGAIIGVRNAHFILPKFYWSKMLLLGACVKTVIIIKRFSALATQCHFRSCTNSLLTKFIGSLPFVGRFWVLLTVSSFREKFSRILCEKRILGSKSKEGLVQIYAKTCLSSHLSQHRHGIFKEFCKHSCGCCWDDADIGITKLALPVSYIFNYAESIWMCLPTFTQKQTKRIESNKDVSFFSHERISCNWFTRRIVSSKELGVVLLGMLQICPSGKLQLMDATGGIDAVVPDFRLHTNDKIIYKVDDYRLIMEGQPLHVFGTEQNKSNLCRNIFQNVATGRKLPLTIYVHFYIKTATCISSHLQLSPSIHEPDISVDLLQGRFHVLFVTHKFPASYNVHADPKLPNASRLYAEAILMPFILIFPGESGDSQIIERKNKLYKYLTCNYPQGQHDECWLDKEGIFKAAGVPLSFKRNDDMDKSRLDMHDMNLDSCPNFSFCDQCSVVHGLKQKAKAEDFEFPLDVSCYLTSNNFGEFNSCFPAIFSSIGNCNKNGDSETSSSQVVLEFNSGSYQKFQVLHIGSYYIMRCDLDTSGCKVDDFKDSCSGKVLVTPGTHFWGLSFSAAPHQCKKSSMVISKPDIFDPWNDIYLVMNEVPLRYFTKNRLIHQRLKSHFMPHDFFDLKLYLPLDKLKFLSQVLSVVEASKRDLSSILREARSYNGGIYVATGALSTSHIECLLLGGNFISVCGEILDIHCLNCCSVACKSLQMIDLGNTSWLGFLLEDQKGICFHVNEGHRMVKIRGTLDAHACPSGIGPGTIATFYRVLSSSSREGQVLLLTPATFIVINAIREVDYQYGGRCFASLLMGNVSLGLQSPISSSLIRNSFHCPGSSPIQIRGRVVSVSMLVLEKHLHKYKESGSWGNLKIPSVSIPLAGFIFDDGSSSCCCWAAAESAAALLRLNETASKVFITKQTDTLRVSKLPSHRVGHILQRIIRKHRKIIIKNICAATADDLSCLDFSFSSCLNKTLSTSDEDLLKFIILNACSGSTMRLIGCVKGSDVFELVKKYMDMPIKMHLPYHFWVEEVYHVDCLADARNIFQELVC